MFLNVKDDKVVENYLGRVVVINESHEVGATSREEVRSALKKRKVMVLDGEKGLECKISVDGVRLEQVVCFG